MLRSSSCQFTAHELALSLEKYSIPLFKVWKSLNCRNYCVSRAISYLPDLNDKSTALSTATLSSRYCVMIVVYETA